MEEEPARVFNRELEVCCCPMCGEYVLRATMINDGYNWVCEDCYDSFGEDVLDGE